MTQSAMMMFIFSAVLLWGGLATFLAIALFKKS